MTAAPWMKFYPPDWRADPALRMCSLAARGLWMEMLCLMHEACPRGDLRINGQPVTETQLASLCGASIKHVRGCLAELEGAGVFSRDNGVVFSRRMRRDQEKAERDKANGRGGGNPILKGGVNPPDKGEDKAHIPEARSQNQKEDNPAVAGSLPKYAFESGVVRLTRKDLDRWKASFSHLDVPAELESLAGWAQTQRQWFNAVAGALAKRNREIGARLERERNPDIRSNDEKFFGVGNTPGIL